MNFFRPAYLAKSLNTNFLFQIFEKEMMYSLQAQLSDQVKNNE